MLTRPSEVRPTPLKFGYLGHHALDRCGPDKHARVVIVVVHVLFDGGYQFRDAPKDPSPIWLVRYLTEPPFHHAHLCTRPWDEMQPATRMTPNPGFHARMFMGPVIVHDQMQFELEWRFAVNFFEETGELLMPMTVPSSMFENPLGSTTYTRRD